MWSDAYVGFRFADGGRALDLEAARGGLDCWGLLRLAFWREHQILLDAYERCPARDAAGAARLIREGIEPDAARTAWHRIALAPDIDWACAWPFDGVLMREGEFAAHVGLVVRASRRAAHFLHAPRGQFSRVDRSDDPAWRFRIVGLYRHASLDRQGRLMAGR